MSAINNARAITFIVMSLVWIFWSFGMLSIFRLPKLVRLFFILSIGLVATIPLLLYILIPPLHWV